MPGLKYSEASLNKNQANILAPVCAFFKLQGMESSICAIYYQFVLFLQMCAQCSVSVYVCNIRSVSRGERSSAHVQYFFVVVR